MHLYFIRHGQTNYNILSLCNDDPSVDVQLTRVGIEQAESLAEKLKHRPIDHILTSQLVRTKQTAEIINRHHHVDLQVTDMINDIRSGCDSQPVADYLQAIAADPLHTRVNQGESLLQHKQRIIDFIEWLKTQAYQYLLVVAHEETLRVVYAYFNQLSDLQMLNLHFDNCEVLEYQIP